MFVYKKLKGSDVALVPFNTHKQFNFVWTGLEDDHNSPNLLMGTNSGSGCRIYNLEWYQNAPHYLNQSNIIHKQIDHLYYGAYPFNAATTFGDVNYQNQYRNLDRKGMVISIPQKYYGNQIKPGSFSFMKNMNNYEDDGQIIDKNTICFDDGQGNLLELSSTIHSIYQDGIPSSSIMEEDKGITTISGQNPFTSKFLREANHPSASINFNRLMDPKNRLLSIYPRNAYKKRQLFLDEKGERLVNDPPNFLTPQDGTYFYASHFTTYQTNINVDNWNSPMGYTSLRKIPNLYSEEFVYDDSYYRNLLTYKNIWFDSENIEDRTNDALLTHNLDICNTPFPTTAMKFIANHNNNCSGSQIMSPHNEKFNFNLEDDFSITFHLKLPIYTSELLKSGSGNPSIEGPFGKQYIIGKSTTKTTVGPPQETSTGGVVNLSKTGSSSETTASAAPQFPFEIFIEGGVDGGNLSGKDGWQFDANYKFVFAISDGVNTVTASCAPAGAGYDEWQHVTAIYEGVHSGSEGRLSITTTGKSGQGHLLETASYTNDQSGRGLPILKNPLQNNANIYVGCKGGAAFGVSGSATNHATSPGGGMESGSFFEGSLYGINIWDYALHPSESKALTHLFPYDGTRYVGNIFYESGIAVITDPSVLQYTSPGGTCPSFLTEGYYETSSVSFQGTHTIYENEYQCTVQEDEMNYSTNISTRKIPTEEGQEVADFTTGSNFQPYVTTVGLYNEENELLVVGKLGQPVRTSQETDTTFVLRWDT